MSSEASKPTWVAIDLETTGLFPETDRIVEIGAVRFDLNGGELGRFERLVHPGRPMSRAAQAVHGISDADLSAAPRAEVVLPEFFDWLGDPNQATLLAHHARFDAGFLGRELARLGLPLPAFVILDTLALVRQRLPQAPNHQLDTVSALLGLKSEGRSHRALADCLLVKGLWLALDGAQGPHVVYELFDPSTSAPPPSGWEPLAEALVRGARVRMIYSGGTRGDTPRDMTPKRFSYKGGVAYVVGFCHVDYFEKSFRLDRIVTYDVLEPVQARPGASCS